MIKGKRIVTKEGSEIVRICFVNRGFKNFFKGKNHENIFREERRGYVWREREESKPERDE